MRLNWILLLTVVVTSAAEARPRRANPVVSMPTPVYTPAASVPVAVATSGGGLAQSKAEAQARSGRCFHPGGSLGGGSCEGCGFSSVSADDAVRHCCYWGQRTPIDIGVARGSNGWYATVLYR
jgi:hypothetical protein